jgi:hypothetical protein
MVILVCRSIKLSLPLAQPREFDVTDDRVAAACAHLQGFIQLVNNYINAGFLTPAQGQPLINAVATIRTSRGCN